MFFLIDFNNFFNLYRYVLYKKYFYYNAYFTDFVKHFFVYASEILRCCTSEIYFLLSFFYYNA